ncbi:MAG TPA: penicillin-binding transpeptidase domain-containing protein, partial [Polyangiales bacterium]|nr:penicillin-binding transpeptidase domain-containing protein [Polyangiales bacterium]
VKKRTHGWARVSGQRWTESGMPSVQGMSMFHRRLTLVAVLVAAGSLVPLARLFQLTVIRGEQLAQQSEGRLTASRLIDTTRGRILDRKGRVLAQDRPGFDVKVDYSLISGQWAFVQAAREAKKNTPRWNELPPSEREAVVQRVAPKYLERLEHAWDALSRWSGVSREELEDRRQALVRRVSVMAAELNEFNRTVAEREALERGRELSEVNLADVERPIREQTVPHVMVRGLEDSVAFAFPAGEKAEAEGLLPGMKIVDGATREYPLEEMAVTIDREGFPGTLRSSSPLSVQSSGVATAVVGWMRSGLYKEELKDRALNRTQDGTAVIDLSGYIDTDAIGVTGMERGAEDDLRGSRGMEVEQLDTGQKQRVERKPGGDVTLTLDAALQARIQALMSPEAGLTTVQSFHNNKAMEIGTRLPAAVVVMDVKTGDILSLVSTPVFTRRQLREDPESILSYEADREWLEKEQEKARKAGKAEPSAASALPFLNRAFGKPYAPGSIVKPLILNFASAQGVYGCESGPGGEHIACTGHYFPNQPTLMRCWIYKQPPHTTHSAQLRHDPDATEAIMASCNIFFFTLGARLGPDHLAEWFGKVGVGRAPGTIMPRLLDDTYQVRGDVLNNLVPPAPSDEDEVGELGGARRSAQTPKFSEADTALLGIGQGQITWTPVHAADAYCTLARGGIRLTPRLRTDAAAPKQQRIDLGFKPRAVSLALRGLERSVGEERGTGHHISFVAPDGVTMRENTFNLPNVRIWGKSGTADSGKFIGSGDERVTLDHAWFVVLAGPAGGEPTHAVAVMVEYGGSGGRVAGPLCNQVLWQLHAEGYL